MCFCVSVRAGKVQSATGQKWRCLLAAGKPFSLHAAVVGSKVLVLHKVLQLVLAVRQAHEELEQVQDGTAGEGVLVAAAFVPQVRVALVVEHLVRGQVHAGVEDLRENCVSRVYEII